MMDIIRAAAESFAKKSGRMISHIEAANRHARICREFRMLLKLPRASSSAGMAPAG